MENTAGAPSLQEKAGQSSDRKGRECGRRSGNRQDPGLGGALDAPGPPGLAAVICTQQKSTSPSSGGQELGASRFGVWRGLLPHSWHLLTVTSLGRRDKRALWGLFCKAWIPLMRVHPHDPITSQGPISSHCHPQIRFQYMTVVGGRGQGRREHFLAPCMSELEGRV